ncbi:MAG: hypothetical protein E4G91_00450 [Candidatus Zixiibacteriota bacterium]|nr:MAG: hypothetical protein E4G91_00450 [candidate division Zixibacteria bacterium]
MATNAIDSTLTQQVGAGGSTAKVSATASKYGAMRMARFLLRSLDDCIDVCETVTRQVQDRVRRDDIVPVFHEIECWAIAVPNTTSSIIVGLGIPSLILEDQRTITRPIKPLKLDFSKSPKPVVKRTDKALVIAHDVKSFFDLNAFYHYVQNPEGLKAQGLELVTIGKTMSMMIKKRDGIKANFALILTCALESDGQTSANQSSEAPQTQA